MTNSSNAKRDWLDYVDLLVKIIFGGILAFGLSAIQEIKKEKQQEIDNSLKFGEFTKSLIKDLLTKDSNHLQSDIALIVLNHTIGKEDSQLIADLGSRVVIENFYEKQADFNQRSISTVLEIVKKRNLETYKKLLGLIADYNAKARSGSTIKLVGKTADSVSIVNNISNKDLDKITLLQSNATVFMQVNKNAENQYAQNNSLFNQLKAKYNTPAIEVVTAFPFKNAVKYYYSEDKKIAAEVQMLANSSGLGSFKIIKLENPKARKGLIELWYSYK